MLAFSHLGQVQWHRHTGLGIQISKIKELETTDYRCTNLEIICESCVCLDMLWSEFLCFPLIGDVGAGTLFILQIASQFSPSVVSLSI